MAQHEDHGRQGQNRQQQQDSGDANGRRDQFDESRRSYAGRGQDQWRDEGQWEGNRSGYSGSQQGGGYPERGYPGGQQSAYQGYQGEQQGGYGGGYGPAPGRREFGYGGGSGYGDQGYGRSRQDQGYSRHSQQGGWGGHERSDFGRDTQGWDRGAGGSNYGNSDQQYVRQGRTSEPFDPDYHQWRQEQVDALDEDYRNWRNDRYKKFSDEFNKWRTERDAQRGSDKSGGSGSASGQQGTTGKEHK